MWVTVLVFFFKGFPDGSAGKESACNVGDLGWEDPLEKGAATHSSIWPGEFHGLYSPWVTKSWTRLSSFHFTSLFFCFFPDHYLEVELLGYRRDACTQLCLTLCNPMDCSPPGSFVPGIFQERIMEWVAISFSRGSSPPRDQTCVSFIGRQILYH